MTMLALMKYLSCVPTYVYPIVFLKLGIFSKIAFLKNGIEKARVANIFVKTSFNGQKHLLVIINIVYTQINASLVKNLTMEPLILNILNKIL